MGDRRVLASMVGWLVCLAVGCASNGIEVSTTFDPLVPFPREAGYVWDEAANKLPQEPSLRSPELVATLKQVIEEGLAARGYRPVPSGGEAPYRLSYELDVNTWYGGPQGAGSVGTLWLRLVDSASKRRVWLGVGKGPLLIGLSQEERKVRLREAMKRMFEKFPPSQRGQ